MTTVNATRGNQATRYSDTGGEEPVRVADPAQSRSEEAAGPEGSAASSISLAPHVSAPALPAPSSFRARLSEQVRLARKNLDVAAYNGLIAQRIFSAYGAGGAYDYRDRELASVSIGALDNRGIAVFTHELNQLLASPKVRGFLDDLTARAGRATPQHQLELWKLAIAHAGSRDEALRWIAVVLQDYSSTAFENIGCLAAVGDPTAREKLRTALVAIADAEDRGALSAFPDGADCDGAHFYHYYVPAYLAQRLVKAGVSPDLAFLSASTFNLEYEIVAPALLVDQMKHTVASLTPVVEKAFGSSLATRVSDLQNAHEVDSTFSVADLDLRRDLHLTPQQIAAIIAGVDHDRGLIPEAKQQIASSNDLTMNSIAEIAGASYSRSMAVDAQNGAWLAFIDKLLVSRHFIGDYIANGTHAPVPLSPLDAQGTYAGFAGAAIVLPEGRPPLPRAVLLEKLLANPTDTMRQLFAPRLASPPVHDNVYVDLAGKLGRDNAQTAIAVVDQRFNASVPKDGWDFIDNHAGAGSPWFYTLHGTSLVSLAQRGTDAIHAIPLRSDLEHMFSAIAYAAQRGAPCVVISQDMTAASPEGLQLFREVLRRYPELLVIIASGNTGTALGNRPNELATVDEPNLVVVAAATATRRVSPVSTFGPAHVRFAMRGGSMEPQLWQDSTASRVNNIVHRWISPDVESSSHAAPAFANLVAKVKLLAPELSPSEVLDVIATTSYSDAATRTRVRDGIPDNNRAERLAALLVLRRRGVSPQAAAERLGLTGGAATTAIDDCSRFERGHS